jgi:hypothetical protein
MSVLAYHNEATLVVKQAGVNAISAQLNLQLLHGLGWGAIQHPHTGKPLNVEICIEMRIGVTYRVYIPLMSGLMGVLAHTYFPSMLVVTGTMTIEFAVANATNACVCVRPHGEVTTNAHPEYYYEG